MMKIPRLKATLSGSKGDWVDSRTDHLGTRGRETRKVSTVYGCGWPSKTELAPRRNEEGVQVKDNISVIDDWTLPVFNEASTLKSKSFSKSLSTTRTLVKLPKSKDDEKNPQIARDILYTGEQWEWGDFLQKQWGRPIDRLFSMLWACKQVSLPRSFSRYKIKVVLEKVGAESLVVTVTEWPLISYRNK